MIIHSSSSQRRSPGVLLLACAVLWVPAARVLTPSISVNTANGALHIRASGLTLIEAESLTRLKDGRSIRVDLELGILPSAGATAIARTRQTFVVSYDLWEERFAVTQAGEPSRSISHVSSAAAEGWCLAQLSVPLSALGRLAVDLPFWIRLEYRVLRGDTAASSDVDEGFTLRALIDALSRRRQADESMRAVEAGPFRLTK
jgi:hypothetical protein